MLTFSDRHARDIEDSLSDLDDHSDDGSYQPSESSDDDDDFIYDNNNDDDYTSNDNSDNNGDLADINADVPESGEADANGRHQRGRP